MKMITINPNNEPYYSDDFIKGFECGTQRQLEADKVDMPTWIPCSERLPQYRDVVLISTFWGVRVAERDGIKEDGTDDFWYLFLDDATARPMYVYAWMPLPEPWKGVDDEAD